VVGVVCGLSAKRAERVAVEDFGVLNALSLVDLGVMNALSSLVRGVLKVPPTESAIAAAGVKASQASAGSAVSVVVLEGVCGLPGELVCIGSPPDATPFDSPSS